MGFDATNKWEGETNREWGVPIVTLEQSKQRLANPRTHELVQALRLPEYWREVGWPDVCRPIGEHDFECE